LPLQIRQPVRTTMNDSEEERWFLLEFRAGRSYCVETGNNNDERPEVSIAIYANAEGTDAPAASSSMTAGEPLATLLARACFIASASGPHAVKVTAPLAAPYVSSLFLRVVETTVWSSWFFQGGDYNSFVLLRNTTNIPVSFTVTWRTADGTVAGTSRRRRGSAVGDVRTQGNYQRDRGNRA